MDQSFLTNTPTIANSFAEQKAKLALNYSPFHALNLENIKNKIKSILEHIGKNGVFTEYTKHDISHIDKMLASLNWIIPEKTKEKLCYADWLMIVLSIYFHDLGMIVTKDEYEKRNTTEFKNYKEQVFSGVYGIEFKSKINILADQKKEEFLYQEFVRIHHAQRIKAWILNKNYEHIGISNTVVNEIATMLNELDSAFRKDLALVCESHHLDDLGDITKYKLNAAYGSSDQEIVDLQYASVILRTADLLHITSDRTPSIEFRLINPSDPISQNEWYK